MIKTISVSIIIVIVLSILIAYYGIFVPEMLSSKDNLMVWLGGLSVITPFIIASVYMYRKYNSNDKIDK